MRLPSPVFGMFVVLLSAAVVSGCARQARDDVNWQHASVAKEEWSYDISACRRSARNETEKEARLHGGGIAAGRIDNLGGGFDNYAQSMDRFDLKRFETRRFETCMRKLGYTRIAGE